MRKRVYESSSFSSSEVAVRVGCSHGNNASKTWEPTSTITVLKRNNNSFNTEFSEYVQI